MKAFVLATGQSMSQGQADAVRASGRVFAVSDAFRLAPWADALVSTDKAWWSANPDARLFAGEKFSAVEVDGVRRLYGFYSGTPSGLLALKLAVMEGAKTVVLLGFDMHGTHYFGPHAEPLTNTDQARFKAMQRQFAQFHPEGVEIVNCSPGTALESYPKADLADWI